MQEGFLFDSNDTSQHNKGVDRLGTGKDGVLLQWKSRHHQIAFAEIGNYNLETVFWHTRYEARVSYYGREMESDKFEYKTKISAQIGAEKLFKKIVVEGNELLNKMERYKCSGIKTGEEVLAKHARNYKKTIEEDGKTLFQLQLNGHDALSAMEEYASQFKKI